MPDDISSAQQGPISGLRAVAEWVGLVLAICAVMAAWAVPVAVYDHSPGPSARQANCEASVDYLLTGHGCR